MQSSHGLDCRSYARAHVVDADQAVVRAVIDDVRFVAATHDGASLRNPRSSYP